jgi:hypothetical protein
MSKIPSFTDFLNEDLRNWFGKGKEGGVGGGGWDRYNTKGERIGKCGDADDRGGDGEGKPKCLSTQKANQLRAQGGKQAIANAVKRKKEADPVTDRPGTGNTPKMVSNRIKEENEPTNPSLWSKAKSMARSKFDVYPSAYANGWAAKWYKDHGGGWRTKKNEQVQTSTPADREWGTDSLVAIYKHDTPGETHEAWEKNPNCQQCKHKLSPAELKRGDRVCAACVKQNKGRVWGKDSDDDYEEQMDLVPMRSVNEEDLMVETFNTVYPWHAVLDTAARSSYRFSVPSPRGTKDGTVEIWSGHATYNNPKNVVTVIFKIDGRMSTTGLGDGVKFGIFTTVIEIIKDYIKKYHPYGITFDAEKVSDSDSRGRLYTTLVQRFAHTLGYTLAKKDEGEDADGEIYVSFTLHRVGGVHEHIVKVKGGYRLVSKKTGKNLGTYPTKAGAAKRERQVQYFKHHEDTSISLPSFKQFVAEQSHANTLREKFFDGFEGHGHDGWTEVWIDPTTGEVADASRKTLWQVARGKFPIPPDRAYRCRAWVTSKHVFVWDAEADNHMDVEAFVQRSAREQKLSMDFSHAIPLDLYYWPNAKKLGIRVSDWSAGGHVDVMTAVATLQKHPWIKGNSAFKNIIPV